jgi:hypothetical protein
MSLSGWSQSKQSLPGIYLSSDKMHQIQSGGKKQQIGF